MSRPQDDPLGQRPSWDEYFLEICAVVAKRSTCLRRRIGAILVKERRILTTGYNGPPRGLRHCAEMGGCHREKLGIPSGQRQELCRALHAEQNAIIQAALHGVSTEGGSVYITNQPCVLCAKMLINAGIKRVVYRGEYPDPMALEMLNEAEIEVVRCGAHEEADGA
ncbi:MAG TPA: cytidine/deoxycytidylate deaminase family protein [Armatimonadota bacterium]|nr:cytidine/deoxycytidylate deaminase family protein [Armatimonadota bacterium]